MKTEERIVIAVYKPLEGKSAALKDLMKKHLHILRSQGLVSDRESIIMESSDNTIVEVFGWKSKKAMESAHTNPVVQEMWAEYEKVCEYIPLVEVSESHQLFSEFTPFN